MNHSRLSSWTTYRVLISWQGHCSFVLCHRTFWTLSNSSIRLYRTICWGVAFCTRGGTRYDRVWPWLWLYQLPIPMASKNLIEISTYYRISVTMASTPRYEYQHVTVKPLAQPLNYLATRLLPTICTSLRARLPIKLTSLSLWWGRELTCLQPWGWYGRENRLLEPSQSCSR